MAVDVDLARLHGGEQVDWVLRRAAIYGRSNGSASKAKATLAYSTATAPDASAAGGGFRRPGGLEMTTRYVQANRRRYASGAVVARGATAPPPGRPGQHRPHVPC